MYIIYANQISVSAIPSPCYLDLTDSQELFYLNLPHRFEMVMHPHIVLGKKGDIYFSSRAVQMEG